LTDLVIHPDAAADARFLEDMLVEAANAPDGTRSRPEILADPAIACYIQDWPRPTDIGVVAVDTDEHHLGAAWLRYFTETNPGHGFLRADIPQLVIGVTPAARGKGVGRTLLRTLFNAARDSGVKQISVSVERANFASASTERKALP
jgi:GNAT superfamily N-acetyltransferase